MLKKLFLILLSFISVNIITSSFQSSSDGYDKIGFPFIFYQKLGGKALNYDTSNFFKIHYLIIDFAIISSVVLLIFFLYKKMK